MAFQFDENTTPIDGAEAIARLLAMMIAAGASCQSYGTGLAGAFFPAAGDLIFNDPAVGAPLLRAVGAFVEIVFGGVGGTKTLLFQRGADNATWLIRYCPELLDDSAADEDTPGTHADLRTVFASAALFPADNALGAFRCSVAAGFKGASEFGAYLVAWNIGTGQARTVFIVDPVTGVTGDADPYVFYAEFAASAAAAATVCSTWTVDGAKAWCWYRYGTGSQNWGNAAVPYRTQRGTSSGFWVVFPAGSSVSGAAESDDLFAAYWSMETASNVFRVKGLSQMFCQNTVSRATGWTLNPSGAGDDYVSVGVLCAPWPEGVAAVI